MCAMRPLRNFKTNQCCHLISRIANRAFYSGTALAEIEKERKQLANGPRRPSELRAALGMASANFFTARYLTPLAKSGYIAVAGGEKNRYLPGKQYKLLRKGKAVACAQPHHFYPTIRVRPSKVPRPSKVLPTKSPRSRG